MRLFFCAHRLITISSSFSMASLRGDTLEDLLRKGGATDPQGLACIHCCNACFHVWSVFSRQLRPGSNPTSTNSKSVSSAFPGVVEPLHHGYELHLASGSALSLCWCHGNAPDLHVLPMSHVPHWEHMGTSETAPSKDKPWGTHGVGKRGVSQALCLATSSQSHLYLTTAAAYRLGASSRLSSRVTNGAQVVFLRNSPKINYF